MCCGGHPERLGTSLTSRFASDLLSGRDESDSSIPFMNWGVEHSRYDLCGKPYPTINIQVESAIVQVGRSDASSIAVLESGSRSDNGLYHGLFCPRVWAVSLHRCPSVAIGVFVRYCDRAH